MTFPVEHARSLRTSNRHNASRALDLCGLLIVMGGLGVLPVMLTSVVIQASHYVAPYVTDYLPAVPVLRWP